MTEYIKRSKAIEFAKLHYCKDCNSYNGRRCKACAFNDAMRLIGDVPTDAVVNEIKVEAYKECVEKVKKEIDCQPHSRSLEASGERFRIIKILNNLLKEMVGDNSA